MRFDLVLRNWAAFFEREGIRWAVIGGLAMQSWGRSRFTKDVDIVVEARQKTRVIKEAESRGYETIHVSSGFSNHHSTDDTLGRVDFMYVDDETAAALFATATERPFIGDLVAPVPRPEYIAMMKCISMKNAPMRALFEGEDVRLLLNLPGVDVERVKEFFERHGMLELFDAIRRAR